MSIVRFFGIAGTALALSFGLSGAQVAGGLIADGDFNKCQSSGELRRPGKGQAWYESRRNRKGHRLLFLSKKTIGGNATQKAMVKASPVLNTYLSQMFASPQGEDFSVRFDILVKEILTPINRSAFFMVGDDADKKDGPNSTGVERFVFMGFENSSTPGKMNLFARQGSAPWDQKTTVASGLDLGKWVTIEVSIHPSAGSYEVSVQGVTPQPVPLKAFAVNGKSPRALTAVGFASWNDGPGTFYIDNVSATKR